VQRVLAAALAGRGGVAAKVWVKAQAAVEEACRRRTEMLL